jgi:hypothetical protein
VLDGDKSFAITGVSEIGRRHCIQIVGAAGADQS